MGIIFNIATFRRVFILFFTKIFTLILTAINTITILTGNIVEPTGMCSPQIIYAAHWYETSPKQHALGGINGLSSSEKMILITGWFPKYNTFQVRSSCLRLEFKNTNVFCWLSNNMSLKRTLKDWMVNRKAKLLLIKVRLSTSVGNLL